MQDVWQFLKRQVYTETAECVALLCLSIFTIMSACCSSAHAVNLDTSKTEADHARRIVRFIRIPIELEKVNMQRRLYNLGLESILCAAYVLRLCHLRRQLPLPGHLFRFLTWFYSLMAVCAACDPAVARVGCSDILHHLGCVVSAI